jgi:hypothetical protein
VLVGTEGLRHTCRYVLGWRNQFHRLQAIAK